MKDENHIVENSGSSVWLNYEDVYGYYNPFIPKGYFGTSIKVFRKRMLQAANTDPFNRLVPKARNREC